MHEATFQHLFPCSCLRLRLPVCVAIYPTGSAARVFAALTSGHEHVTAEAGRLLTRLWAPRPGRRGAPTWTLTKGSRSQEEDGGHLSSVEDPITAKQAKSICLGPAGRCTPAVV